MILKAVKATSINNTRVYNRYNHYTQIIVENYLLVKKAVPVYFWNGMYKSKVAVFN